MISPASPSSTCQTPTSTSTSTKASTSSAPRTNNMHSNVKSMLRCLLLDLPMMLLFAAYVSLILLEHAEQHYLSRLHGAFSWTDLRRDMEVTSYHYSCTANDISARVADELVVATNNNMTSHQAVDHMLIHGATLVPDILSNATADALRAFILLENKRQEGFYVIANDHRYSFGIEVNSDPIVSTALNEIAHHPVLRPMLEILVGRNPAVVEFTAITSEYGAEMQNFHQDVIPEGSAAKYGRSFVPSYSLFVTLQDTTEQMGATSVCPGTQLCANEDDMEALCGQHAIPVSGSQDKWPKGWGALINQQTTHRGTAHKDPHGAARVVFILTFAPRPQYSLPGVVESRMLGQGGSYSIHWRQWGFTLQDFGNAPQAMVEPWRTLRTLGLYKSSQADWGWDMVTVALMRMANGDNGYNRDTLETFVMEKGGFAFLPSWLQGDCMDDDDYYDDDSIEDAPLDGGWYDYLVSTGQKIKEFLALSNQIVLGIFFIGAGILSICTAVTQGNKSAGVSVFLKHTGRVLLTHGSVLGLAWLLLTRLNNSLWARHVQSGKLFRPYSNTVAMEMALEEEYSPPPYTLANQNDVLVAPQYQSRYLASYSRVLEFNQPGNTIWRDLVASSSRGFDSLTLGMQGQFCKMLIYDIMLRQHRSRFLLQTEGGRWSELPTPAASSFCHRELIAAGSPLTKALLGEIERLQTETKFGAWRDMSIHQSTIPNYLAFWMDKLLRLRQLQSKEHRLPTTSSLNLVQVRVRQPLSRPLTSSPMSEFKSEFGLPSSLAPIREPYDGAWFSSGDVAEGKYRGVHNEFYKGIVMDVSTDRDTYDVIYDDGEEDFDLCRHCVRRFKPYAVGETLDARVEADEFAGARVLGMHTDSDGYDIYDISFLGDAEVVEVSSEDLRRSQ